MKEMSIDDLEERLMKKADTRNRPHRGEWEITYKCNLKCRHCYRDPKKDKKELSLKEIICHLDHIYSEGCLWLTITGGEPFMRDDFQDIYSHAKKMGFLIVLFTNGTLFTRELINFLKKDPPIWVEITLHGATRKTYERVTQMPGSYEKCMEGIRTVSSNNIPLIVKTVGMNLNKHEIQDIRDIVKSLPGTQFKFDSYITPRRNGDKAPLELRMSIDEIIEVEEENPDMKLQWQECTLPGEGTGTKKLFRCTGGISSFHINPYGRLQLCNELTDPSYDLRNGNFREGFHTFLAGLHKAGYHRNVACLSCEIIDLCGQCPAKALMETGTMDSPVDYMCRLTHTRAEKYFNLHR